MSISITKIEKKAQISLYESVKYQLIHELIFKRNEQITILDLSILIFIGLLKETELSKFCKKVVTILYKDVSMEDYAIKSQNIRNRIGKLTKRNILVKENNKYKLNSDLNIVVRKDVLLSYNFLVSETKKA
jgi:hypothetical protein